MHGVGRGMLGAARGAVLAVVLALVAPVAAGALLRTSLREGRRLWAHRQALAFDDLLLGGALAVLLVAGCWLALSVTLTAAVQAARYGPAARTAVGRRLGPLLDAAAHRVTPGLCRAVLAGVGGAVLVTPTAVAAPGAPAAPDGRSALPLPDRPVPATRSAGTAAQTAPAEPPPTVVVRPGDTLWAIAARHLPARVDTSEVCAAWPVWFHANRVRLGPDPDLIHPGTRLAVPRRFYRSDKDLTR